MARHFTATIRPFNDLYQSIFRQTYKVKHKVPEVGDKLLFESSFSTSILAQKEGMNNKQQCILVLPCYVELEVTDVTQSATFGAVIITVRCLCVAKNKGETVYTYTGTFKVQYISGDMSFFPLGNECVVASETEEYRALCTQQFEYLKLQMLQNNEDIREQFYNISSIFNASDEALFNIMSAPISRLANTSSEKLCEMNNTLLSTINYNSGFSLNSLCVRFDESGTSFCEVVSPNGIPGVYGPVNTGRGTSSTLLEIVNKVSPLLFDNDTKESDEILIV